jgi:hypothetical protein
MGDASFEGGEGKMSKGGLNGEGTEEGEEERAGVALGVVRGVGRVGAAFPETDPA